MTKEQVLKEFKNNTLSELEIEKIVSFYRAGADLLGVVIGARVLTEEVPLKLTLNSLKYVVTQILEMKSGQKSI